MKKKVYIKVCPKCGSSNVMSQLFGRGPITYYCKDCDFGNYKCGTVTVFFPEIEKKDLKAF